MELHDFLAEYYKLFADLETNKAQFPDEFYLSARKLLSKQFEQATETFLNDQKLEFAEQRFKQRFDVANYTPRRRMFFWWNRKAKALLKQYRADLECYLAGLSKGTRDAYADKTALDNLPGTSTVTSSDNLPAPPIGTDSPVASGK